MNKPTSTASLYRPATGRLLVAYTATNSGRAALNLAVSIAKGRNVSLEIVGVSPEDDSYSGVWVGDTGYEAVVTNQITAWLQDAVRSVPQGITARARIYRGESETETLNRAAKELHCDGMIIGSQAHRITKSVSLGSTVNALLHSATRPVAIAPRGYTYMDEVTRVTAMFGPRNGSTDVVALCLDRARRRGIPARLVSLLVQEDKRFLRRLRKNRIEDSQEALDAYTDTVLAELAHTAIDKGTATTDIAAGHSVAAAVKQLEFIPGEIAFVGSSRLAAHGRIFLGSTGAQLLEALPVPLVVVPAGFMTTTEGGEAHDDG